MAWDFISALEPGAVSRNALAGYNHDTSTFTLKSFGYEFSVDTSNRTLKCEDSGAEVFLGEFREFLRLGILWYLSSAREIEPTGKLIKPSDVKGGHIYVHGTHQLPLGGIAEAYGADPSGFVDRGRFFGAEPEATCEFDFMSSKCISLSF